MPLLQVCSKYSHVLTTHLIDQPPDLLNIYHPTHSELALR